MKLTSAQSELNHWHCLSVIVCAGTTCRPHCCLVQISCPSSSYTHTLTDVYRRTHTLTHPHICSYLSAVAGACWSLVWFKSAVSNWLRGTLSLLLSHSRGKSQQMFWLWLLTKKLTSSFYYFYFGVLDCSNASHPIRHTHVLDVTLKIPAF